MSSLVLSSRGERLRSLSLEELFSHAEQFGRVHIYSSEKTAPPSRYHARIEFDSIPGTSLKASSEFKLPIAQALMQAIDRAEQIVAAYGAKP